MAHTRTGSRQDSASAGHASPEAAAARRDERARIARDVHDDIGGNLAGIKMALAVLMRRLPADSPELLGKANYVDELIDRTIEAVHRLAGNLAPDTLQHGLLAAIAWHAAESTRQTGIPCDVVANDASIDRDLSAEQAAALLRIFCEAMTNIGKHAQAARVSVHLERIGSMVKLDIADDGKGMQPADRSKAAALGIRGMSERAHELGGDVSFLSATPHGTVVVVTLPLKEGAA